jgi:hypothetical protein
MPCAGSALGVHPLATAGEGISSADKKKIPRRVGSFFSHRGWREKKIPGAAGQVVPPGPPEVVPPGRVSHN